MPTTTQESPVARLIEGINQVLIGKPEAVLLTVVTLIARGHLLIEDIPGIGKTLLGLALAHLTRTQFRRIQFTNDLLPSDILGVTLYSQKEQRFEFHRGPIFTHVLLADEINRSTPKTQSALLEAMNELQVSVDGTTHALSDPFMVIATENPVEYHGTFPLPDAQLDRFLMRVQIGYPESGDEKTILRRGDMSAQLKRLEPCLSSQEVLGLQQRADEVRMEEELLDYVVAIARATRHAKQIRLGLSPRGSLALCRAARAWALAQGRDYCIPDDIKRVAVPVVAHRLVLDSTASGMARILESENAVQEILRNVPAPR